MNYIEKITKKATELKNEEVRISNLKKEKFFKNIETIKGLSARINKMWDIAQALLNNGFKLGEKMQQDGCYTLESDCWYHQLGFVVSSNVVVGFGIVGGGCCGEGVMFDRSGDCNIDFEKTYIEGYYTQKCVSVWEYSNIAGKVETMVTEFDEYEKKFYGYVEKNF